MSPIIHLALVLSAQLACVLANLPLRCFIGDDRGFKEIGKILFEQTLEVPEKEQPELDNFFLKDYIINQDDLFVQSKTIKVVGFENSILDDIGMNFDSNLTRITFHTDLLMKGPYKVSGSLLSIPIEGEGDFELNYKNFQIYMVLPFEIVQNESGKRFMNLQSGKYSYDMKNGFIKLNNLYGGDKALSDAMHSFINRNWKLLTFLYGKDAIDQIIDHVFDVFKSNLLRMPLRQSC